MKTRRLSYRVGQLWRAARARPAQQDLTFAQSALTPAQMALFKQMQPFEQAHSLKVAKTLIKQGENDADLITAALLHDVGKTCRPLRLWERTWIVVGQALFPSQSHKWGNGLRGVEAVPIFMRPFLVAEQHPQWGARLALKAGVSPRAAGLIRMHQVRQGAASHGDRLLTLLQSVDDES